RKSTATHYQKHGPSGLYIKAAKGSLPITEYYTKPASQMESEAATGSSNILELKEAESVDILESEESESAQDKQDEMDIEMVENGVLPVSMQGCYQKTKSFIDDEDVIEESLEFIRKNGGKITPKLYRTFINNTLFSQMRITALISEKTARVWLKKLELVPQSR